MYACTLGLIDRYKQAKVQWKRVGVWIPWITAVRWILTETLRTICDTCMFPQIAIKAKQSQWIMVLLFMWTLMQAIHNFKIHNYAHIKYTCHDVTARNYTLKSIPVMKQHINTNPAN